MANAVGTDAIRELHGQHSFADLAVCRRQEPLGELGERVWRWQFIVACQALPSLFTVGSSR